MKSEKRKKKERKATNWYLNNQTHITLLNILTYRPKQCTHTNRLIIFTSMLNMCTKET